MVSGLTVRTLAEEPALVLPPLEVSADDTARRSWSFWKTGGVEVLSRCSDDTTWAFIESQARLVSLLDYVLPPALQGQATVPTAILLAEADKAGSQTQDLIAGFEAGKKTAEPGARRTVQVLSNLRLTDVDRVMVFALLKEESYDADAMVLTIDNLRYRLLHRTPALPLWFTAGMLTLFPDITFAGNEISIGAASWCPDAVVTEIRRTGAWTRDVHPLASLLEGVEPPAADTAGVAAWWAEAALLIRWALDGDDPARRAGFFRLVDRGSREPLTDAVCKEELGLGCEELGRELQHYLPRALRETVALKPPRPLRPAKVMPRLATGAEIARIKGDWERLTVGLVEARRPEFAAQYADQARRTLSRAYAAGERDPEFMAVAGLFACDRKEYAAARPYLEHAVFQGAVRPRVYLELARLRYQDAVANPYEPGGYFGKNQMDDILVPLHIAQAWAPPLAETYVLAAMTWSRGQQPVPASELSRLDQGLDFFPKDGRLLYYLAVLHLHVGQREVAAQLVARGRQVTTLPENLGLYDRLQHLLDKQAAVPEPLLKSGGADAMPDESPK